MENERLADASKDSFINVRSSPSKKIFMNTGQFGIFSAATYLFIKWMIRQERVRLPLQSSFTMNVAVAAHSPSQLSCDDVMSWLTLVIHRPSVCWCEDQEIDYLSRKRNNKYSVGFFDQSLAQTSQNQHATISFRSLILS